MFKEIPFSLDEINKYIDKNNHNVSTLTDLREKLLKEKVDNNIEYKQDCSNYEEIYAMGDLHADYISFYKRLENFKLIDAPNKEDIDAADSKKIKIDIKNIDDCKSYLPILTSNFEWIAEKKTLLVITGDIVDGRRDGNDIYDPFGSIELLLHMFLKNLKFKAREKGSDVICIYGNHDMFLFFPLFEISDNKFLLQKYVHSRAILYFSDDVDKKYWVANGLYNRTQWLAPFYKNDFYFVFELTHDKKTQIQFVHGALHGKENYSLYDDTITLQNYFKSNFNDYFDKNKRKSLTDYLEEHVMGTEKQRKKRDDPMSAIWQRTYQNFEESDDKCNAKTFSFKNKGIFRDNWVEQEGPTITNGPTIIVGHCICAKQNYVHGQKEKNRMCIGGECIYPKCFVNGIPRIVMVDTNMSSCFEKDYKDMRSVEILRITKSNDNTDFPYFNNYESLYFDKNNAEIVSFKLTPDPDLKIKELRKGGKISKKNSKKKKLRKKGKTRNIRKIP